MHMIRGSRRVFAGLIALSVGWIFLLLFTLLSYHNGSGHEPSAQLSTNKLSPSPKSQWIKNLTKGRTRIIKSCLSPSLEEEERTHCRFYAAVIDAGSTGTRIHVFELSHDIAQKHSPFKVENETFYETKPGLSMFAGDPVRAALGIRSLITAARAVVPTNFWNGTPIVMKATAGLRLLPDKQAEAILRAVEAVIRGSGLLTDENSVGILSGTDEGVFGWFTLNFLLGRLKNLRGEGVEKPAVALDLGGGSTQITFLPTDVHQLFHDETNSGSEDEFGHTLRLFNNTVRLYTHSYLGNGLVASRLGIGRLLATKKSEAERRMITHCFPAEYTLKDWDYAGRSWTITASPEAGFDTCMQSTRAYVTKMSVQTVKEIADYDIYAIAYFYDRAKQASLVTDVTERSGLWIRVGDYADVARRACALSGTQLGGTEHWRPWQCLDLCYIYTLLHDGYGLSDRQQIRPIERLKGMHVSWALGAGFNLLNTYHARAQI